MTIQKRKETAIDVFRHQNPTADILTATNIEYDTWKIIARNGAILGYVNLQLLTRLLKSSNLTKEQAYEFAISY